MHQHFQHFPRFHLAVQLISSRLKTSLHAVCFCQQPEIITMGDDMTLGQNSTNIIGGHARFDLYINRRGKRLVPGKRNLRRSQEYC